MPVQKKLLVPFPFFGPLTLADFERVARAATRLAVPAQTLLFQEGDAGDAFYMLISGKVEIVSGSGANERTLNLLGAGAWFGELALIDNQPRSASARALTTAVLVTLPKSEFLWLVTTYPLSLFILVSEIQATLRERDRAFLAEAEQRVTQLEQLYSTALDITRHRERDEALGNIRERAVDLLASAGGDLYLLDAKQNMLVPQTQEFLTVPARRAGEGCVGQAFQLGQACIGKLKRRSHIFELAAPIRTDATTLGVLCVYRASDGAPYQESDKTLIELFASQAAIVIENAQLNAVQVDKARLDGELSSARLVQRSLIPNRPPHIPGYQIAALWEPARQVSGDLYDFIPLPDRRYAVVIADVSDKGTPAALFMASARSSLRASATVGGTVMEMVERANRAISGDASGGMFVTLIFGILDPQTHVFSYVNAGHNYPLLARGADGSIEILSSSNLAFGIVEDYSYTLSTVKLERGDTLLLYTDGVTEATNAANRLFGDPALYAALKESQGAGASRVIQTMHSRVRQFTGTHPQSDDITAIVIKRT